MELLLWGLKIVFIFKKISKLVGLTSLALGFAFSSPAAIFARDIALTENSTDIFSSSDLDLEKNSIEPEVSCPEDFEINSNGVLEKYTGEASTVIIPDGVKKISYGVFLNRHEIEFIVFPESLKEIDDCALFGCTKIKEMALPESLEKIGQITFGDCRELEFIYIGENVKSIDGNTFWGCNKLTNISVNDKNQNYCAQKGLLYNKAQTELICCPAGISGSVEINKNTVKIKDYAFYNCENITKVTAFDSLMYVDECAFSGCKNLKEVKLGNKIKKIRSGAFERCSMLTEFVLPETVTELGSMVFMACENLNKVSFLNKNMKIGEKIFTRKQIVKIIGISGSTAQKYAESIGLEFEEYLGA